MEFHLVRAPTSELFHARPKPKMTWERSETKEMFRWKRTRTTPRSRDYHGLWVRKKKARETTLLRKGQEKVKKMLEMDEDHTSKKKTIRQRVPKEQFTSREGEIDIYEPYFVHFDKEGKGPFLTKTSDSGGEEP